MARCIPRESKITEEAEVNIAQDAAEKSKTNTKTYRSTRKSAEIFGLGKGITTSDSQITGSRLPSCQQVLRCFLYHQQRGASSRQTNFETAKIVLAQVSEFYKKANIPVISEIKASEKLIKLANDNAKLRAIPVSRRATAATQAKVKHMECELNKTFQIWPRNAAELIKIPEDRRFLESMMTDRSATFGSKDKLLADRIQRKESKIQKQEARREKVRLEAAETCTSYAVPLSSEGSSSENETSKRDTTYVPASSPSVTHMTTSSCHRRLRTGTPVFIPHDILKSPQLVALSTRMKISPAQQAAFVSTLIEETGGDASTVATSYATADKLRGKVGEKLASSSKEMWVPPKFSSLHWDSKIMSSLTYQKESEERLSVSIGTAHDTKLLGLPSYKPGTDRTTGDIISELTVDLLNSWNCANSIINMVFDTTASNTGHLSAACIAIQSRLQRALLWSACRHHVGEVILTHVFSDLRIEVLRSPDISLFSRFSDNYGSLPHQPLTQIDISQFSEMTQTLLRDWITETLHTLRSKVDLARDDYREFVELCIVFLGGTQSIAFKRPGAIHKARWMAKLLYAIKIILLQDHILQLPQGTVTTPQQLTRLRDFVLFATIIYSSWWMTCSSATDAPWNDLTLYKKLLAYDAVNATVSQSAIRALKRHLWYLTQEMIPLALFSEMVPKAERQALASRLLEVKPDEELASPCNRFGSGFGKPKFPENISESTSLADLAGSDSWFTLNLLCVNEQFFAENVEDWPLSPAYQSSVVNVGAFNVVNDSAERNVKLSSDFLSAARSERHYQNVLQMVEQDRKSTPNLRKRKLHYKDTS